MSAPDVPSFGQELALRQVHIFVNDLYFLINFKFFSLKNKERVASLSRTAQMVRRSVGAHTSRSAPGTDGELYPGFDASYNTEIHRHVR